MAFPDDLEPDEQTLIRRCLQLVVDDSRLRDRLIDDWEFQTLFGLDRAEMNQVLQSWPQPPDVETADVRPQRVQLVAVVGALNILLGYPHGISQSRLEELIGAPLSDVEALLLRLP